MQRFTWDMRYPGPWAANAPNGGRGGPMAAPGKYTVRLTAGGQTQTRIVRAEGRSARARTTASRRRISKSRSRSSSRCAMRISDARRLQQRVEEAMKKAGVAHARRRPCPASTPSATQVRAPAAGAVGAARRHAGHLPQPMLISQLQNVARMVGQADQKIGKDAVDRFNDLMKELQALQAAFKQSSGTTLDR